ncbi:hypothetical protein ScPMuIL_010392 [Solemya velum]
MLVMSYSPPGVKEWCSCRTQRQVSRHGEHVLLRVSPAVRRTQRFPVNAFEFEHRLRQMSYVTGPDTSYSRIAQVCDGNIPSFTSGGQSMTLTFHTDSSQTYRGFKIRYTAVAAGLPDCTVSGDHFMASGTKQFFRSPGYPGDYASDLDVTYLIEKPQETDVMVFEFSDFAVEYGENCQYDFVSIHAGACMESTMVEKLCGSDESDFRFIYQTGKFLVIRFKTDGDVALSGFEASYVLVSGSVSPTTLDEEEDGIAWWLIVVIVVLSFPVAIFGLALLLYLCRGRSKTLVRPEKAEKKVEPEVVVAIPFHPKPKSKRGIRQLHPAPGKEIYTVSTPPDYVEPVFPMTQKTNPVPGGKKDVPHPIPFIGTATPPRSGSFGIAGTDTPEGLDTSKYMTGGDHELHSSSPTATGVILTASPPLADQSSSTEDRTNRLETLPSAELLPDEVHEDTTSVVPEAFQY